MTDQAALGLKPRAPSGGAQVNRRPHAPPKPPKSMVGVWGVTRAVEQQLELSTIPFRQAGGVWVSGTL